MAGLEAQSYRPQLKREAGLMVQKYPIFQV